MGGEGAPPSPPWVCPSIRQGAPNEIQKMTRRGPPLCFLKCSGSCCSNTDPRDSGCKGLLKNVPQFSYKGEAACISVDRLLQNEMAWGFAAICMRLAAAAAAGAPPSFFNVGPLGAPAERETVIGAEDAVLSLATQGLQSCVLSVGPPSGPVPAPGAPKPSCGCCLSLPLFCDSEEVAALRHQGPPLPLRERGPQERDWGRPRACSTLLNAEPEDAGGGPSPPSTAAATASNFGFLGSGGPPYPQEERGPPGTFQGSREPPTLSSAATAAAAAAAAVAASQAAQQQHRQQQQQRQELSALDAQLSRLHSPHSHRGPFVTPASGGAPGGGPHRFFTSDGPRLDVRAPVYIDRGPSSSYGLAAGGDVLMGGPARGPPTTEGLLLDRPLDSPSPEQLGGPPSLQDLDREVGALVGEEGESFFGDASPGSMGGAPVEGAPSIGPPLREASLSEEEAALNRQQSSLELQLLLQARDSQPLQPEDGNWY
ncbi:hypothetical protein Emed_006878 [Eimeria media]